MQKPDGSQIERGDSAELSPEQAAAREGIAAAIDPVEAARLAKYREIARRNRELIEAAREEDANWRIRHLKGRSKRRDYGEEV